MSRIFSCDVCSEEISAERPRIHCQECRSYDLCANCFVCQKTSRDHEPAHATMLFEMSGYVPRPPPVPPRPSLPQRPAATPSPTLQRRPVSMQVPRTASGPSVSPPPQTNYQPPSASSPPVAPQTSYPPPPSSASAAPPRSTGPSPAPQTSYPPPPSQPPRPSTYTNPPPAPEPQPAPTQAPPTGAWGSLFNGQAPTALGMAFFGTLFSCLDTDRTGLLRPEQYSSFLDVCGYTGAEDVWKHQMSKPVFGYTREDLADYELKQAYINFSIDHQLSPRRPTAPNTDLKNWAAGLPGLIGNLVPNALPPLSAGLMPMLTRQGFIDICTVEFLYDPNRGWAYAKAASRRYAIWREWGEVPRSVLPEVAPPELVNRAKLAQVQAQARAQETIDAHRARAMLEKQGREAALDLVSDRRYYR